MRNKWDIKAVNKLKKKGLKVTGDEGYVPSEPIGLVYIKSVLDNYSLLYKTEYIFHDTRKWRLDLFLPDYNIGIEYEGVFSEKSRHTTYKGYTEDCNKYNAAASMGITVFRYTAKNYKNITVDLTKKGLIN